MSKEKKDKFPTRKDLGYWILILVMSNVLIFTLRLGDNTNVIDYMGFAGTIMSLILAVIAIIYSFYQNSTYVNSTQKLESSADKIESITDELTGIKEFKHLADDFNKNATSITNSIQELKEVVSTIEYGIGTVHQDVKSTRDEINNMMQSQSFMSKENIQFEYTNDYFKNVVENMSKATFLLTVWVKECYLNNLPFEHEVTGKWMVTNAFEQKEFNTQDLDYHVLANLGIIIAYQQLGFFYVNHRKSEVESFEALLLEETVKREEKEVNEETNIGSLIILMKEFLKDFARNDE